MLNGTYESIGVGMKWFTAFALLIVGMAPAGCSRFLASGPATGTAAPAFEAPTTEGEAVSLDSFQGQVVVLEFFAVWCPPCKKIAPNIQALHERLEKRDDAALLAIHFDDNYGEWESPAAYLAHHGYTYPVIPEGAEIAETYGIELLPAIIVIGTDGTVIHRQWSLSSGDVERIERRIDEHLAESKGSG